MRTLEKYLREQEEPEISIIIGEIVNQFSYIS